ncbi:energy transducer TonB [Actibacterium sp. D379-3]
MKRLAEIALFVPVAAGLHLAAFGLAGGALSSSSGGAQGAGGDNLITLAAAAPQMAALVETWDAPPEAAAQTPAPLSPPQPEAAAMAAPTVPVAPPRPPLSTATPTLATPDPRPEIATEPAPWPEPADPRPAPATKPAKPSAAAPAKRAAGSGGGAAAGQAGSAADAGQQRALASGWAAQIQARVARAHRVPATAARQGLTGEVLVRMVVGRDGRLISAGVRRGSGHAVLDRAALQSVRRAGRFPAAPAGFTSDRLGFDVPLVFALN